MMGRLQDLDSVHHNQVINLITILQMQHTDTSRNIGKDLGADGTRQFLQALSEAGEGFVKGAAIGGAAGMFAGPAGAMVGAIGGGIIKAFQQSLMDYSGTTNRQVVDEHFHPEHFTGSRYTRFK